MKKLDHDAHCATNPNDRISLRANDQTEYVMLTTHDGSGHSAIDLLPAASRAFATKLFEAAELIDGNHYPVTAADLQKMIVRSIAQFIERAYVRVEELPANHRPTSFYGTLQSLRDQIAGEIGPTKRFRLITEAALTEG